MKRALCANSMEDIANLIHNQAETIDLSFVDRAICEDPNNKFLQIIPYVTFFTTNGAEGKIKFVQYRRAAAGGEDRLLSKTSIGFGGHIDQLSDISFSTATTAEDGTEHFVMTKDELSTTIFTTAVREVTEEVGCDILAEFGITLDFNETAFFMGDQSEEVNQVHVGLSIPVRLTGEQYDKFFELATAEIKEIEIIDKMTLNVRHVIEEMDVTVTMGEIITELKHKNNLEDWSCRVFDFISRKEIFILLKDINYDDIYRLSSNRSILMAADAKRMAANTSESLLGEDMPQTEGAPVIEETVAEETEA